MFHFDRLFGLGSGFTTPSPYWGGVAVWQKLADVTATDNYTVVLTWKSPVTEAILEMVEAIGSPKGHYESPEAVKQWGDLNDWHHAIGTGPFILTGFCYRQFGDFRQESQLLGIRRALSARTSFLT